MKRILLALACIISLSPSTIQSGDTVLPPLAVDWKETVVRQLLSYRSEKYHDKTKFMFLIEPVPCTMVRVRYSFDNTKRGFFTSMFAKPIPIYDDEYHGYAGIVVQRTKHFLKDDETRYFFLINPSGKIITRCRSADHDEEIMLSNSNFLVQRNDDEDKTRWEIDLRYWSTDLTRRYHLFRWSKFSTLPLSQ